MNGIKVKKALKKNMSKFLYLSLRTCSLLMNESKKTNSMMPKPANNPSSIANDDKAKKTPPKIEYEIDPLNPRIAKYIDAVKNKENMISL